MQRRHCIVGFAVLAVLAAAGARGGEWSLDEAIQRSMLRNGIPGLKEFEPRPGDSQYGATFYESKGSGTQGDNPRLSGWCILVEEGRSEFRISNWKEKKSSQRPWRIWYQVNTFGYLNSKHFKGVEWLRNDKSDNFLETMPKELMGLKVTPRALDLGDGARIASARGSAVLNVTRHPIHWGVRVTTHMQMGDLDYNDPGLMVRDSLIKNRDRGWPEAEKLGAKFSAVQARVEETATRLASQILGAWDAWAARRIGPGPGFKGLYEDLRPYAIFPEDMPAGFKCTNYNDENIASTRAEPWHSIALHYSRKRGTEQHPVFESQNRAGSA